jgi:hypothetical protein
VTKDVRLLDDGATDLEALLLRAGREDVQPDPLARARTIENIKSASHAAILGGGGLLAARWLGRSWSTLTKWALVAGFGVSAVVAVVYLTVRDEPATAGLASPRSAASAHQQDARPPSPAAVLHDEEIVAPPTPEATSVRAQARPKGRVQGDHASSSPARVPTKEATVPVAPEAQEKPRRTASESVEAAEAAPARTLREETARLEGVRRLLEASRAAEALTALDGYDARFASGLLAEEAAVLRVEALLAAGNIAGARRVVADFEARYPSSSYRARVHALIERKE